MHTYNLRSKKTIIGYASQKPSDQTRSVGEATENPLSGFIVTSLPAELVVEGYASQKPSDQKIMEEDSRVLEQDIIMAVVIPQPSYTLIFDTETTGLFYTNEISPSKLKEYPHMIQLAYELMDENTGDVVESYNSYIQLSDTIEISEQIQHITGITKEKLSEQGIPIVDALVSFYHAYSKSNRIVAHNISFDIKMIQVEIMRNYASMREDGCPFPENIFNPIYEHIHNKDIFCTMKHGIKITNLWKRSYKSLELPLTEYECIKEHTLSNGQIVRTRLEKKFPKLENLYVQIYDIEPQGLHDAKMDVEICRKVYIYLSIYLCLSRVV